MPTHYLLRMYCNGVVMSVNYDSDGTSSRGLMMEKAYMDRKYALEFSVNCKQICYSVKFDMIFLYNIGLCLKIYSIYNVIYTPSKSNSSCMN